MFIEFSKKMNKKFQFVVVVFSSDRVDSREKIMLNANNKMQLTIESCIAMRAK